ncbi:MAG: SUMF1/EgtB/PvdO family nonheme iron enzyme [Chloroflexota bacterium]
MPKPRPNLNWIGHSVGDRYRIEELLGQGGMSAVYKATDPNLRRTVAVKLIHPHLSNDPEFVRRFEQEAAAVAQLRHANIIQVFDFNHDEDLYYMVLEYVPGQTLQNKLATLGTVAQRLPLRDSISIVATIGDAVDYAHRQGMIHRDLKPANVMLTPRGEPILMDFGVAKMLGGTQHTATGAIVGTAKYMSPEQARGERADERTDIYSLGVILYELVAGQPPFDADTTVAVLMQHVTQPVPDIRKIRSDTPEALVTVIEKALAKKPEERYQRAAQMAATLHAITLPGEAVATLADQVDSTRIATSLPHRGPGSAITGAVAAVSAPAARPAKSGRPTLWLVGAAAALLLVLGVAGAIFLFSGSFGFDKTESGQAVIASAAEDLPSAQNMVKIEAGSYTVGLDPADNEHAPAQRLDVAEFWIDRYEVSNTQFAEYLAQTGVQPPVNWPKKGVAADQVKQPVRGVTWDQATAYCEWTGKRLPTEAEWEIAARGADSRLFPWGDDPGAVELPRSGTYEVGRKLTNQTPSGVFDLAGNVWEWVGEPYTPIKEGNRLLRGGANGFVKDMAYRLQGAPNVPTMFATAGIRCAASRVDETQRPVVQLAEGVLYQDIFADPGSGWPVLAEGSQFFGYHPPDFFHIELSEPNRKVAITRPSNFDNVTVETEVRVDSTNTEDGNFRYGLAVRQVEQEEYYAFTISYRAGSWQILKSSSAGQEVLAEGPVETLKGFAPKGLTPDQSDTLRVDADDSNFAFYINEELAAEVSDAAYPAGQMGFYVETFDETRAHVHFDVLTVRELVDTVALAASPTVATEAGDQAPPQQQSSSTAAPEPTQPTAVSDTLPTPAAASPTLPPTLAPSPSAIPTDTVEPPTPTGMVLVPAGSFTMGSASGQPDEAPPHEVSLDAFFIDRLEVSNAAYRQCVSAGACTQTASPDGFTRTGYRDDPAFSNYPVINVTWDQATAYCRFAGKRLPTEAEWEYAARGPFNLTYPWGNNFEVGLSAAASPDTEPVDSFPGGASPFGVFNMAGNVNEWVQDVYSAGFYAVSPAENPVNSGGGSERVFRGGSFANEDGAFYTTSRRYSRGPAFSDVDMGFRCVQDAS